MASGAGADGAEHVGRSVSPTRSVILLLLHCQQWLLLLLHCYQWLLLLLLNCH